MIGCCSEAASTSFDEVMLAAIVDRLAGPGRHKNRECLVEHLARARSSTCSPVLEPPPQTGRRPDPRRGQRPSLSRSSVAVPLPTFAGRRRASGVTMGPSITSSVAASIAAKVIHGSAASYQLTPAKLIPRTPCRCHIAANEAIALSDTAAQPNVRICRESRASPRPSRRRNRLRDTSHRSWRRPAQSDRVNHEQSGCTSRG